MQNYLTILIFVFIMFVVPWKGSAMSGNPQKTEQLKKSYAKSDLSGGVSKEEDIKKLVKLIDPDDKNVEWLKGLFVDVTKTKEHEWDRLLEEIDFNVVASLYYPIYDKYFTHNEIKELMEFYSSDAGIKLAQSKNNRFPQPIFSQGELGEIDQFKKTATGKKYNNLLSKMSHQYVQSVKKYITSLR